MKRKRSGKGKDMGWVRMKRCKENEKLAYDLGRGRNEGKGNVIKLIWKKLREKDGNETNRKENKTENEWIRFLFVDYYPQSFTIKNISPL